MATFVLTIGQDPKRLQPLVCTTNRSGVPLVVDGRQFQNFFTKIYVIRDFLVGRAEDDVVVAVDGYDVVAAGCDAHDLRSILTFYKSDVVAGAESGWYWPEYQPHLGAFFDEPRLTHRFPNAGCVMGTVRGLRRYVDAILAMKDDPYVRGDDQFAMARFLMTQGASMSISLDAGQLMCSNTWGHERDPNEMVIEGDGVSGWYMDSFKDRGDGRLVGNQSGMPTCFIHDCGRRTSLPLPDGASWWRHELSRRCISPDAPVAQDQLSYAQTPQHRGGRSTPALCTPPQCTLSWDSRPVEYSGGSTLEALYGAMLNRTLADDAPAKTPPPYTHVAAILVIFFIAIQWFSSRRGVRSVKSCKKSNV